ncbi:MAG: 2-oxoacid:acceptor oxidoreductase subunit alpha [Elusimicrobia bacterium]|nr:2-oxoacid:acceptor oxidoreductase subunit alpha [Elusimicrobiota bacterium]
MDERKGQGAARELDQVTIRLAGDSGEGIQLTGAQFTATTALAENDLSTFPDFPSEIRAPAGTPEGVSGFQIHFGSRHVFTPGDEPDVLVAFNPAALKANIRDLRQGGLLVVNTDAFTPANLKKAGYEADPLEDGSLSAYRAVLVEFAGLTAQAVAGADLPSAEAARCKNFFALGMMYWLYDRPLGHTRGWIERRFADAPEVLRANLRSLEAGESFADTTELFGCHYAVRKAPAEPGLYRNVTGNEAAALGLVAASVLSDRALWYGAYPITPASDILHELARHKSFGVRTFQAEDEIAAIGSALGAAYAGMLGATGTSGPGLSLKTELLGLAVMAELPLVVIDVQRAGPSTGMPTKTSQADLLQAVAGRHGECPLPVLAAATPADCFDTTLEAFRIAVKYMTPVVVLLDGYLANGLEPWRVPDIGSLPRIEPVAPPAPADFKPYGRDPKTLARPWVAPGLEGYCHRIGGLEKSDGAGDISQDPENHAAMVRLRAAKVAGVRREIPPVKVTGPSRGKVLVACWGSTYGAVAAALEDLPRDAVAMAHVRHLNPLPPNLGEILGRYDRVLVPELNLGQFGRLLRAEYLVPVVGLHKTTGQPFKVREIRAAVERLLAGGNL